MPPSPYHTISFTDSISWADPGTASYPTWWETRGVVASEDAQPPAPSDPDYEAWVQGNYAPANLGQAKNMAKAAYLEMESLSGESVGGELASMVTDFSTDPSINYAPLNLGQLKAIAKPFYDTMHAESGFVLQLTDGTTFEDGEYPWDSSTPVAENYVPANLGQLKYVFSFLLIDWPSATDRDGDGMDDEWEEQIISAGITDQNGDGIIDVADVTADADFDQDGLTNKQEYIAGTNPTMNPGQQLNFEDLFASYEAFDDSKGWLWTDALTFEMNTDEEFLGIRVNESPEESEPTLCHEFNGGEDDVYFHFSLKADDVSELPDIYVNNSVRMRFTDEGEIEVYNGYDNYPEHGVAGRWIQTGVVSEVGQWHSYILHVDFNHHWYLYQDGLYVMGDLGFCGENIGQLARVALISAAGDSYELDEVRVRDDGNYFKTVDGDGDGLLAFDINNGREDLDGDGNLDVDEDANGNGILDEGEDLDGDGRLDVDESNAAYDALYDSDFDRLADHLDPDPSDSEEIGAHVSFPYGQSFRGVSPGPIDGQDQWEADAGAVISAHGDIGNDSPYGINVLVADEGDAVLKMATYGVEPIFVNMHAKFSAQDLTDTVPKEDDIYAFALNESGYLYVWVDGEWVSESSVVYSEEWHVWSVEIDFQSRTWNLWVDGKKTLSQIPFVNPTVRSLEKVTLAQCAADYLSVKYDALGLDDDSDGMPDVWESVYFGDLDQADDGDYDADGLTNLEEYLAGSLPDDADEDGDGLPDSVTISEGVVFTRTLPFGEDFEGFALGDSVDIGTQGTDSDHWNLEGGAAGTIVSVTDHEGEVGQVLSLSTSASSGALTHYFDVDTGESVWIEYYIQPVLLSELPGDPTAANSVAICYLEDGGIGRLYYYRGKDGWKMADAEPVFAGEWVRISIIEDVDGQVWSLYQDNKRVMDERDLSNVAPMFYAWAFDATGEGTVLIDDIFISADRPSGLDDDGDGLSNEEEDIDGDGIVDEGETDPYDDDTDGDYIADGDEVVRNGDDIDYTAALDANDTGDYGKLPIKYSFDTYAEGLIDAIDGWQGSGATVVVDPDDTTNHYLSIGGGNALSWAMHPLVPSTLNSDLYVTFKAKLNPSNISMFDVSTLDEEQANFLLALDENGEFVAYDPVAGIWSTSSSDTVFAGNWIQYQIYINTLKGIWSLSVEGETIFENVSLRNQFKGVPYIPYWSIYYAPLVDGDTIAVDDITVSHRSNTNFSEAIRLPIVESFTGYESGGVLLGVEGWSLSGAGGSALIIDGDSYDDDSRALALVAGTSRSKLSYDVEDTSGFVTVSFALKPILLASEPEIDNSLMADFYFDQDGKLYVSDGDKWRIASDYEYATDSWYLFRFVYDTAQNLWRLDIDKQTVVKDLSFASEVEGFDAFGLSHRSESPLLIDALTIKSGAPPLIEFDGVCDSSREVIYQTYYITGARVCLKATFEDPDDSGVEQASFVDSTGNLQMDEYDVELYEEEVWGYVYSYSWGTSPDGDQVLYATITDRDDFETVSLSVVVNFSYDTDHDDLPDEWEVKYLGDIGVSNDGSTDTDLDGYTDEEELVAGADPADYFNTGHSTMEITPVLTIISGDAQAIASGSTTMEEPLVLRMTDVDGNALANAPVYLSPQTVDALIGSDSDMTDAASPFAATADSSGEVILYVQP